VTRGGEPARSPATSTRAEFLPVEVRSLHSHAELAACVALQRATWGSDYIDVVPASILQVAQKVGGIAAGAFDAHGDIVGFVFGLTGVRSGRLAHWSHMLAVRGDLRDRGIGRRLKEFQRQSMQDLGVEVILWTFDPLVARNAHLNLNRLGVTVIEYVEDMYGDTGSELHRFGTDRFIVEWPAEGGAALPLPPNVDEAPVLNTAGDHVRGPQMDGAAVVRVEIPEDIEVVQRTSPGRAMRWRQETRQAFLAGLHAGYAISGFYRQAASGRCFYVLRQASQAS
jgi:predicted GNAT superfamily acetyltransferase